MAEVAPVRQRWRTRLCSNSSEKGNKARPCALVEGRVGAREEVQSVRQLGSKQRRDFTGGSNGNGGRRWCCAHTGKRERVFIGGLAQGGGNFPTQRERSRHGHSIGTMCGEATANGGDGAPTSVVCTLAAWHRPTLPHASSPRHTVPAALTLRPAVASAPRRVCTRCTTAGRHGALQRHSRARVPDVVSF